MWWWTSTPTGLGLRRRGFHVEHRGRGEARPDGGSGTCEESPPAGISSRKRRLWLATIVPGKEVTTGRRLHRIVSIPSRLTCFHHLRIGSGNTPASIRFIGAKSRIVTIRDSCHTTGFSRIALQRAEDAPQLHAGYPLPINWRPCVAPRWRWAAAQSRL